MPALSLHLHGSCAARAGQGVVLLGPSGAGKSDLLLRLVQCGFMLVADDQVLVEDGVARAPSALAGLLEVRGLGIVRLPWLERVPVRLAVELRPSEERLPLPERHPELLVPLVRVDPFAASATACVLLALDCALGRVEQVAGAFGC